MSGDDEVLEGDVCQVFPASPLTGGHEMMVNLSAMDRYMDERLARIKLEPYVPDYLMGPSAFDRWVYSGAWPRATDQGIAVITSY